MPKGKSSKSEEAGNESNKQNIPEEVLQQLPAEVKAQLGYKEEQKAIFKGPSGASPGLSDSIDRLREGFEKIGLTLIGRMGEFASTLERVVMTVARIEKVENMTAETTYFLKNLQKALDNYQRDFGKVINKVENVELVIERMGSDIAALKSGGPIRQPSPAAPQPAAAKPQPPIVIPTATPVITPPAQAASNPLALAPQTATPAEPPAPKAEETPVDAIFSNLQAQIEVGMNSNSVADILDQSREKLSETSKWTPAIYEIGKLARKLRKENAELSKEGVIEINQVIYQCKKQISQA